MIGSLDPSRREVVVVGGGIAGLLAAYELDRREYIVHLIEASPRLGGLITTRKTPYGIAEAAANSLLASPAVLSLARDLGVDWALLREGSRARYILRGGKPRRFPLGPIEAIAALTRAYFALAPRGLDPERLTMEQWGRRFVGGGVLEYGLNPFLRGIYAARPGEICVGAAFPGLVVPPGHSLISSRIARKLGRIPPSEAPERSEAAGRPSMMAPRQGMEQLVRALEARLTQRLGTRLRLSAPVSKLSEFSGSNRVLCVPAHRAWELLVSEDAELSHALSRVSYVPLVSVTVFVPTAVFAKTPRGVGVLIPEKEGGECLGILFSSSSFEGRVRDESSVQSFTVLFGGTSRPDWLEASDEAITSATVRELSRVLKMKGEPLHAEIFRWPRAIPAYDGALMDAWVRARLGWCREPGRILFGNYTGQVSIRGMIERAAKL